MTLRYMMMIHLADRWTGRTVYFVGRISRPRRRELQKDTGEPDGFDAETGGWEMQVHAG